MMTNLREQDSTDLTKLRQLDETEIRYLWHAAWWDGPISGMAEYRGRQVWYDYHSDIDDDARHYRYVLYPLQQEQIDAAELWRTTRDCWDAANSEWIGRDLQRHDAAWSGPDVNGVRPIGWFTDGRNQDFYGISIGR